MKLFVSNPDKPSHEPSITHRLGGNDRITSRNWYGLRRLKIDWLILRKLLYPYFMEMRRVINPTGRHALYSRGLTIVLSFLLYCVGSAGYYSVSYDLSDCTVSITGPSSGWQHGYGVSNGTASGSDISHDYVAPPLEAMASYGSVVCEGEIVVTFTWQPSFAGEEPPQVAVVKKVASAVWSGKDGASDNGLDDEAAVYIDGGSCSGTQYEVVENPGFTFERAISPSASGS